MAIIRLAIQLACLGLLLFVGEINAFAPKAFSSTRLVTSWVKSKTSTSSSPAFHHHQQQPHAVPFDFLLDERTTTLSVASLGDDALQSISVLLGGFFVLLIGFFVYFQSFITFNAAAQLETQARIDYPDLWSDTQTQLGGRGETLAKRPDLVLSLRNQIQAREFQKLQKRSNNASSSSSLEKKEDYYNENQ
jgi:hypothetical protein